MRDDAFLDQDRLAVSSVRRICSSLNHPNIAAIYGNAFDELRRLAPVKP